jgi:hypothetical protein
MERVTVNRAIVGICYMQVCAVPEATDEEILAFCNAKNIAGTTRGWVTVYRADCRNEQRPVVCDDHPERFHFLVAC